MKLALILLAALAGVGLLVGSSFARWQKLTERERFLLALKQASSPRDMPADEQSTLRLLRSPWWALWRWVPDLWRHPPPL